MHLGVLVRYLKTFQNRELKTIRFNVRIYACGFRQLRKRVRAAEMLKSSSLPPSMARRERVKSACVHLQDVAPNKDDDESITPAMTTASDRTRSAMTSILSSRGNNLAAILRCQASRYGLIFNEKNTG